MGDRIRLLSLCAIREHLGSEDKFPAAASGRAQLDSAAGIGVGGSPGGGPGPEAVTGTVKVQGAPGRPSAKTGSR